MSAVGHHRGRPARSQASSQYCPSYSGGLEGSRTMTGLRAARRARGFARLIQPRPGHQYPQYLIATPAKLAEARHWNSRSVDCRGAGDFLARDANRIDLDVPDRAVIGFQFQQAE
jgi:hypothetical protein